MRHITYSKQKYYEPGSVKNERDTRSDFCEKRSLADYKSLARQLEGFLWSCFGGSYSQELQTIELKKEETKFGRYNIQGVYEFRDNGALLFSILSVAEETETKFFVRHLHLHAKILGSKKLENFIANSLTNLVYNFGMELVRDKIEEQGPHSRAMLPY